MKVHLVWFVLFVLMSIESSLTSDLPKERSVELPGDVRVDFCLIPEGEFVMGSPEDEEGRHPDEGPQHKVTITNPIYMGKYEVTQRQWMVLMDKNPSLFAGKMDHPVEQITWNETQEFLQKMNALEIGSFRLPTEAEWEYACRAGTTTRYYWGEDPEYKLVYQYSWFNPITHAKTQKVGQKKPNPWGLYDITGNVWEWCQDWKRPYTAGEKVDPKGAETGERKVFRGSSWYDEPDMHRSANRHGHATDERYSTIGFRLVMDVEE